VGEKAMMFDHGRAIEPADKAMHVA